MGFDQMKLRNKKTGEINNGRIEVIFQNDSKFPNPLEQHSVESFDELNEEWEEVKEPLIKDEKIRKAFRAWAEVNDLCGATYSERPNGCAFIFEHTDGDKTVICFRSIWLGLEKGKGYTITELCGEEEYSSAKQLAENICEVMDKERRKNESRIKATISRRDDRSLE